MNPGYIPEEPNATTIGKICMENSSKNFEQILSMTDQKLVRKRLRIHIPETYSSNSALRQKLLST